MLSVVVLDGNERFVQLLDDELCDIVQNNEYGGLKTLDLKYTFDDYLDCKDLFKIGNKIYVNNVLYVINTKVEVDIYESNIFNVYAEEVLVELNYAQLFTQNELSSRNGFNIITNNDQVSVLVDYNALNYWFGDYFNIGTVQECRNEIHNRISFNGSLNLMKLLRLIEERTGNLFITRYERDVKTNVIHRWLDFLNPFDESKDWDFCLDFSRPKMVDNIVFDSHNNPVNDIDEDVIVYDDYTVFEDDKQPTIEFNKDFTVLLNDNQYKFDSLGWSDGCVFHVYRKADKLYIKLNDKVYNIDGETHIGVNPGWYITDNEGPTYNSDIKVLNDLYFSILDDNGQEFFKTKINHTIGKVHKEVLDLGFNVENIVYETDESETFNSTAPELMINPDKDSLTRSEMSDLIHRWLNLEINKGDIIPFTIEKLNVTAQTLDDALDKLGDYDLTNNYYNRPYHPNDDPNKKYEFYRAVNYYQAPFSKHPGVMEIECTDTNDIDYTTINCRPDAHYAFPANVNKTLPVEVDSDDLYLIYNKLATTLSGCNKKKFEIKTKVSNLKGPHSFNQYSCNDKVFIKLPGYNKIYTTRVKQTSHHLNNMKDNSVELGNYDDGTHKTILYDTVILCDNAQFEYLIPGKYTITLENVDKDKGGSNYPANQLISFNVYNSRNDMLENIYNVFTNEYGKASIDVDWIPDNYHIEIVYNGDAQYAPTTSYSNITVHGVLDVVKVKDTSKKKPKAPKAKRTSKARGAKTIKTDLMRELFGHKTKSTVTRTIRKERYYSKYGVSPDGKYLLAIGRRSSDKDPKVDYNKFYQTVFYRTCPYCGSHELYWNMFYGGNESINNGYNAAVKRNKSGSKEGEITCYKCDSDFSIFGNEKSWNNRPGLKVFKRSVEVNKSKIYLLKRGKYYYDTITSRVKRTVPKKEYKKEQDTPQSLVQISPQLKKLAKSIVWGSTGIAAAKKIAKWCGNRNNLEYKYYYNFVHRPLTVFKRHSGNCCDSARFMATLLDAVGLSESINIDYVHVKRSSGANNGHVFLKLTTRHSGNWRYVDPTIKGRSNWGTYITNYGTVNQYCKITRYPTLPF